MSRRYFENVNFVKKINRLFFVKNYPACRVNKIKPLKLYALIKDSYQPGNQSNYIIFCIVGLSHNMPITTAADDRCFKPPSLKIVGGILLWAYPSDRLCIFSK